MFHWFEDTLHTLTSLISKYLIQTIAIYNCTWPVVMMGCLFLHICELGHSCSFCHFSWIMATFGTACAVVSNDISSRWNASNPWPSVSPTEALIFHIPNKIALLLWIFHCRINCSSSAFPWHVISSSLMSWRDTPWSPSTLYPHD